MEKYAYFATASKGLEGVLAEEIAALGGKRIAPATGGVAFSGDGALMYRANLRIRTAGRILLHLAEFPAPTPTDLYEGVKAVPWPDLFPVRRSFAVDATVRDSRILHSGFAALKTKDAVVDRFRDTQGSRPTIDTAEPEVRIYVRIVRDVCTLSLDTSGESLNRRGYRADPAEAALRETLAAGIVLLSGWDGKTRLVDPACGSGTIPIEAALIAANAAPGLLRSSFGFQKLSGYRPKLWKALVDEARGAVLSVPAGVIEGSDVSPESIRGARRNARKAGVEECVSFRVQDMRDFSPGEPAGLIVSNPPYGVRTAAGTKDLASFYRAMGEALKKRCAGWTAYLLSGNPEATRHLGLKASRRIPLMNGPIDCRLLRYDLYGTRSEKGGVS